MTIYILKRFGLVIPTLIAIISINFFIVQLSPGGPIENIIAKLSGETSSGLDSVASSKHELINNKNTSSIDENIRKELEKSFGFDKPIEERYVNMLLNYLSFNFGESLILRKPISELILEKINVSLSIGLLSILFIYFIAVPLGIWKAKNNSSKLDNYSTFVLGIITAIPPFLLAIALLIFFASSSFLQIFPMRGLYSDNFELMNNFDKFLDILWHIFLPTISLSLGSLATLTLLTKNSFIDELNKGYVITARAKGLNENSVLWGHVFRNSMLIVISGIPTTLIATVLGGSILIEIIFSLDGLGLLGYEAILNRDYPLIFGILYIFTLIGLIANLLGDILYKIIDPRINFERI